MNIHTYIYIYIQIYRYVYIYTLIHISTFIHTNAQAGVKRKQAKTFEEYQANHSCNGAKSSLDFNLEARAIMQAAGIGACMCVCVSV